MTNEQSVWGVFRTENQFSGALEELNKAGLADLVIVKDKQAPTKYLSARVDLPSDKYFKIAGGVGALLGAVAGIVAAPTVPYTESFQILTPIMAAVSGSAIFGYFGIWIGGFLHATDEPRIHAKIFEGTIPSGSFLIAVTTTERAKKLLAMECLEKHDCTELVVSCAATDPLRQEQPDATTPLPKEIQLAA